jgi:DNA repair protein RadA/Sms
MAELDRVLSGGFTPGSVTLLYGEPGVGKSTLLLQALTASSRRGGRCLLVSAEESAQQVRARAQRLGPIPPGLLISATADVGEAEEAIESAAVGLAVVDSVQTITDAGVAGPAGSLAQVRSCVERLTGVARVTGAAVVLVGHVTKAGDPAGPRALEHLVDTVLGFEGERHHSLRVLGALKHRFGPTGEVGLFEMGESGLRDVPDPAGLLLGDRRTGVAGSIVVPLLRGRRAMALELQALVAEIGGPNDPVRPSARGIDAGRLALVLAVLRRRVGAQLGGLEIFVSATGGLRIDEPAADLPLALAVASAVTGSVLPADLVALGEVGLAGELRQVPHVDRRLAEAARLGFTRALVPASVPARRWPVTVVRASTLAEAIEVVAGMPPAPPRPPPGGLGAGTISGWSSWEANP